VAVHDTLPVHHDCRTTNTRRVDAESRGGDAEHPRAHRPLPLRCHGACVPDRPPARDVEPGARQDTEFPGVVARPIGSFKTSSDYHYQTMRCNVDLLKIIQIGITLSSEKGELPEDVTTWQFNFHFSVKSVRGSTHFCPTLMLICTTERSEDIYGPDSVDLLQKSGIDFQKHEEFGIPPTYFAELMITSGLVLSDDTTWVSFHRWEPVFGPSAIATHNGLVVTTSGISSKF
jgi:hypothetical protein